MGASIDIYFRLIFVVSLVGVSVRSQFSEKSVLPLPLQQNEYCIPSCRVNQLISFCGTFRADGIQYQFFFCAEDDTVGDFGWPVSVFIRHLYRLHLRKLLYESQTGFDSCILGDRRFVL